MAKQLRSYDSKDSEAYKDRSFWNSALVKEIAKWITVSVFSGTVVGTGAYFASPEIQIANTEKLNNAVEQINTNSNDIRSLKEQAISISEHAVLMDHIANRDIHLNTDTMSKLASKDDMRNIQQRLERIEALLMNNK